MPRLVLIDGSSYLFRAFHALPPLSNAQGEPTGALLGVVNMLRATLKEKPECAAFVVDASGPTFRDALYAEYKANRPPMPDELRAQVEPMMKIVEALGFPILRVSGVEADDVIGTLAVQAHDAGVDVTISTGDKDFAQLVRPGITLVNTMSGSVLDTDTAVIAKFGVRADQIVDLLALMGDSVDNIPGVDKCGPKTAAKWLAEYGTLAGVMANADKVGGKIGGNLRAALPHLPLSHQLATIKTDVELELPHDALKLRERHVEDLRALYSRYGFNAALRELDGKPGLGTRDLGLGENAEKAGGGLRGTAAGHMSVLYTHTDSIGGWSKWEVVLLVGCSNFIQQLFTAFFLTNLTEISEHIRTGRLDFMLLLPVNTRFLVSLRKVDLGAYVNAACALVVIGYAGHRLHLVPSAGQLIGFAVLCGAGLTIHYSLMFLLSGIAFWTVRAQGIVFGYYNLFNIARLPDSAFPRGAFKAFFTFGLPMLLVSNVPSKVLLGKLGSPWELATLVGMAAACFGVSEAFWRWSLRHYTSASS